MTAIPKEPLRFTWGATKGQRKIMFLCWFAVLLGTALTRFEFYLIAQLVDSATQFGEGKTDISVVWNCMWILIATYLIGEAIWRTSGFTAQKWMTETVAEVYDSLFQYLTGHSTRYFHERFAGAITNKISNAAQGVLGLLQLLTWPFLSLTIGLVGDVYLLYSAHWSLAVTLVLWFAVFVGVNLYLVQRLRKLAFEHAEASSKLKGKLVDTATNIESVHQQAEEPFEHGFVRNYINEEKYAHRKSWYAFEWILIASGGLLLIFTLLILSLSIHYFELGEISVGTMVMLITIVFNLEKNLFFLGEQMSRAMRLYGQIDEGLTEILKPHEIVSPSKAPELRVTSGEISIQDIDFSYGEGSVFSNLSLDFPGGQKIGLVGPSGAGKSTFVNLLLRLYDLKQGNILIDDQNIQDVTLSSLRKQIALVPQSSNLFHRSITENIRYGRLEASEEEVIEAAKLAQAHEFIKVLTDGYETYVGERGVKLSGGQRQRISIARAILKDAPILILDEATSALDSESESAIQTALSKLMEGRTVIAIAHRLSTLQQMDRIIVLEEGAVIEDGSHEELLAANGLYAALWNRQAGGFLGESATDE